MYNVHVHACVMYVYFSYDMETHETISAERVMKIRAQLGVKSRAF